MERLSRVVSIMIDLINKNIVDASYLADKYEVSTRTIYRDIELLDMSGIPIVSEKGKNGGFSILDGFKIDKNILTETEFGILLRGVQAVVKSNDKEAQTVYDKLLSILENSKREKIIKHSNNVMIDISPFELDKEVADNYKKINKAIEEKRCINLSYHTIHKGTSNRVIEPILLLYKISDWYLYAFCREKQSLRCFKLVRMKKVELTDEVFAEREIESSEFCGFFSDVEGIDIVLKTDKEFAKYIQEFHYVTNVEEKDEEVYVTLGYPLNTWVYSVILSFGNRVTVVSPENVKNKIIEEIENMGKLY
ncbi:MAG: YafY family transcriptional regulator [Oscillospiraceae bacterium]|nr:YafY family transcriptional regulator [Oscillospiraceae bacterium]